MSPEHAGYTMHSTQCTTNSHSTESMEYASNTSIAVFRPGYLNRFQSRFFKNTNDFPRYGQLF